MRDQRSFADALAEVAAWLAALGRGREVLLVYLDDQPDLLDWVRASSHRQTSNAALHHIWDLACVLLARWARMMLGTGLRQTVAVPPERATFHTQAD